ncbi:DNA polymerase sliding clamp [Natronorubrum daqingense]|uniref:DNA polymerase sliding clamp n=1 Tax=Natronorubrum daqingense TaxID=588898 RepID=A0A1N7FZK5_9EURY|nr:DNA polymerase sliding clamp [Natronorubrum daqingense]APX98591.1 hypothetical protein BB347_17990 [Natronorubrum daqingense]SIS05759.1 proliferating cell antigen [Natronorubrum daqingense]
MSPEATAGETHVAEDSDTDGDSNAPPDPEADTEESTDQPESEAQSVDLASDAGGFACEATVGTLEAYFGQFVPILDEMTVHLEPTGLEGRGVDPANVAMVDEGLDESAFAHYSSTGGLIGVDLNRLMDILSIGDAGDSVRMELDQETRKLEISIDTLEYTLALIDPDSIRAEPEIPDLELPAKVTLEGSDLKRAVTAAEMVSDHIRLQVDQTEAGEDALIFSAEGDTDDVTLELPREDLIDLEMGDGDSLFSLDYLADFEAVIPETAAVDLKLGSEMPVFIEFEHIENVDDGDDGAPHAEVLQMLAPRISSED